MYRAVHTYTECNTWRGFGVTRGSRVSDTETCLPRFNGGGKQVVVMVITQVFFSKDVERGLLLGNRPEVSLLLKVKTAQLS